MEEPTTIATTLRDRMYILTYTDGQGQLQKERGRLLALDVQGFVVLEVTGKYMLVPKERIDVLVEVE